MERFEQRPVFGWGGYGRSRIRDEEGEDITIADGLWIIVLGTSGWVGYLSFFGLLVLPLMRLHRTLKRKGVEFATVGLAMITAANFIYIIPNSTLSMIAFMMAGALAGYVQFDAVKEEAPAERGGMPEPRRAEARYTRFPGSSNDPPQTSRKPEPVHRRSGLRRESTARKT